MKKGILDDFPADAVDWALRICEWFRRHQRDLPWRRQPEPYKVWLSEIMLQQTRVKTALPYYSKFLESYPRLEDLARAEEGEVLERWAGLGYYRRARNLHRCAKIILEQHGGRFPDRIEELLRLPGIGRYSAGAILSIAFGRPHPVVDGNVKRVLARYLGSKEPLSEREIWEGLESLVAESSVSSRISDFNQGLMELGALVCTPRNPGCGGCPLEPDCRARRLGIENETPRNVRSSRTVTELFTVAVIRKNGGLLLRRNDEGPYLKGFWEFPRVEGHLSPDALPPALHARFGIQVRSVLPLAEVRHTVTFRRLRFLPMIAEPAQEDFPSDFEWVTPGAKGYPVSAYVRKIAALARDGLDGKE